MISKFSLTAAVAAAGLLAAAMPGSAATLSVGGLKDVANAQSSVQKTHGWHRICRRGLNGWHKHVPGVGRIQCTNHRCHTNKWGVTRCTWF